MEVLYWFEKIRVPGLNELMLALTQLGEETTFLVLALIVFWCVDKKKGYFVMSVGFLSIMANQFMKLSFRVPRPWVLDPNFTILEQAREAASGYSFPSGHTTVAVAAFVSLGVSARRKITAFVCVLLAVLVGISRMYLGVHTPADVLAGALTSLILILLLQRIPWSELGMGILVSVMMLLALALLAFVSFFPFPVDVDAQNLDSGIQNAYTMIGCMAGVLVVYHGEKKYVNFTTLAVWWAQILKVILGLTLVLAVKEGLRSPLETLIGMEYPARALRYFLVVVTAGLLWPMSFRWFYKLGRHMEVKK
ncbi:MAG: phosphatase PAP2 family protein [Oscillospiraceae bacterium]|nr:phosphatase PAP2 family protein [Oscillospiraceae bacterium]